MDGNATSNQRRTLWRRLARRGLKELLRLERICCEGSNPIVQLLFVVLATGGYICYHVFLLGLAPVGTVTTSHM